MDRRERFRARAALKPDLYAAVVIPPSRGQDALVADFTPEILIEHVVDSGENSEATVAEVHLRRQVPDRVGGNEMGRGITGISEVIVHDRANQRGLDPILPPVDSAYFELIFRSVGRNEA